jgi:hypothetical protein
MSGCGLPTVPNLFPGESTASFLPEGVIAGQPLPYQVSQVVQVIAGQNYNSAEYISAFQNGNFYSSVSTINAEQGRTSQGIGPQFKSQEDRIKYLKGKLLQNPSCPTSVSFTS